MEKNVANQANQANQGVSPVRLHAHPVAGWVSFLLFQVVILVFCAMLVVAVGQVMPGAFPDTPAGRGRAVRVGIWLSMPVAAAGVIAGVMALLQPTRRRLLGVIGAALNGGYVFLSLVVLGYM